MTAQFAITTDKANSTDMPRGMSTTLSGYIVAALQKIFPDDTVKSYADLIGVSLTSANKQIHRQRNFTADDIAELLRTDHGFEILTAIMADAKPKWWVLVSSFMEVRDAQRLQAEARARIRRAVRGALDADADLTAAIARADTLSDADFYRPHADALRSMAGLPNSSLASTTKGRK